MDFSFAISGSTVETSATSSIPNEKMLIGNTGDDSNTENDNINNNNY
jgi:hypothetical protein